jgi:hypothetical protein
MELRSFIATSISDIYNGVIDAQGLLPKRAVVPFDSTKYRSIETGVSNCQTIQFEVVVRVDEQKGKAAKISVVAGVFGGGLSDNSSKDSGHSATLRFGVPILLPSTQGNEEA